MLLRIYASFILDKGLELEMSNVEGMWETKVYDVGFEGSWNSPLEYAKGCTQGYR